MSFARPQLRAALAGSLLAGGLAVAAVAAGGEASVAAQVASRGDAWVVDVQASVPVALETAWAVLTDFEHMPAYLSNLAASRVLRQEGDTLLVRQEGSTRLGIFALPFSSEREIRLEPMRRIVARQVAGSFRRMESEARLTPGEAGVELAYHAEIVPDSALVQRFGAEFARREVEEQFRAMAREMRRRQGK